MKKFVIENETKAENKSLNLEKSWLFGFSNMQWVLIAGVLGVFVLTLATVLTGTTFKGVFVWNFIEEQSFSAAIKENLIVVAVMVFVFSILAKRINKSVNQTQIINAVLISRLPFVFIALFNIDDFIRLIVLINYSKFKYQLYDFMFQDVVILLFFTIMAVALLVFSVYLLYKGFKAAVGVTKVNYKLSFWIALLTTELISKGILFLI